MDYVARFGCGNEHVLENLDFWYCIGSLKSKRLQQPKQDSGHLYLSPSGTALNLLEFARFIARTQQKYTHRGALAGNSG